MSLNKQKESMMQLKGVKRLRANLLKMQALAEEVMEAVEEKRDQVNDSMTMNLDRAEEWESYLDSVEELCGDICSIEDEVED